MSSKRIPEKELLKNLNAHTAHADELATPIAHEVDPLERLKDSVLRYERPLDPVWDEWFDSESCSVSANKSAPVSGPQGSPH